VLIRNRPDLTSHGNIRDRETVLDILAAGLSAPDPYANTKKMVRVTEGRLVIGLPEFSLPQGSEPLVYDLEKIKNIYIVGGGKSIQPIVKALEDTLDDLITEGHICIKKGDEVTLNRVGCTLAGHPSPDENSVSGAKKILDIERKAKEGDIVFWCNSGGGTSLLALPVPGLTLQDFLAVNRRLYFEHGASMGEINAIRFPMTNLRGKHVRHVHGATLIKIDVDEQPLKGRQSGYTSLREEYPDSYDRAIAVLEKYECWDKIPAAVRAFFTKRDPKYADPTEAEISQRPFHQFRVSGPELMVEAARDKALSMGINATILATSLNDLEVRPVAETFAQIAKETEALGWPLEPPCAFILGGELVVAVGSATGSGGRNQEFVVSTAERIAGSENIVIASADCDGTDGPTDTAGGIVDGYTMERSAKAGMNLLRELANHNTNYVLQTLGDTIDLRRGANVRDLRIIYVGKMAD
jgi:glycerate 2-kinase